MNGGGGPCCASGMPGEMADPAECIESVLPSLPHYDIPICRMRAFEHFVFLLVRMKNWVFSRNINHFYPHMLQTNKTIVVARPSAAYVQ